MVDECNKVVTNVLSHFCVSCIFDSVDNFIEGILFLLISLVIEHLDIGPITIVPLLSNTVSITILW